MSALHVTASTTHPDAGHTGFVGHLIVDHAGDGLVNLDLSRAIPDHDHDPGDRWVSLYPAEARALAAALLHYAGEAGA